MIGRMLGLSDEQKDKVRPIFDEETKQMQKVREQTNVKLKEVLTPEQWEKYSRTYVTPTNRFNTRMQGMVGTNAAPGAPGAPRMTPTPR